MRIKTIFIAFALLVSVFSSAAVTIRDVEGWFESGYATFTKDGSKSYNVYYKADGAGDDTYQRVDGPLVRDYGDYARVDVVGIKAGKYIFKIVPVTEDGTEKVNEAVISNAFTSVAHDRSGFAFANNKVPGGYNMDGTLKNNAIVLYITDGNKNSISLDVITSSKGATTSCTGFQTILNGFKKGYDSRPLIIRLIGSVTDPADADKGDIVVDLGGKSTCAGVTVEGIGNDAVANGWGIRIKGGICVEVRNIGFMNCDSDEGDNVGLQQDNEYIWVHNCDFFYGHAGSDKDQVKGDGALDCKKSNYVTFSYNHFWDSGKCNLLGLSGENDKMYITYHHNWYDHSDSRHPRVRSYSVHVYNNYFDGNAKYGVGACMASSVFVENNYFRNTNKPMMISMQGTDIAQGEGTFSSEDGGIIKAYGNEFAKKSGNFHYVTYQMNNIEFDAYEAASRNEQVPTEVKTKKGDTGYNNFDTDASIMYTYIVDAAKDVPTKLAGKLGAGRMQHGDFQWAFNNAVDDASYDVNAALKSAITSYKSSLIGIIGDDVISGGGSGGDPNPTPDPESGYACHFTGSKVSNSFYTITSPSYKTDKGSVTIGEAIYDCALKIDSKPSITFTTNESMILFLSIKGKDGNANITIDDQVVTAANEVISYDLSVGSHTIKKGNAKGESYLFYINLTSKGNSAITVPIYDMEQEDGPIYDLSGRMVTNPQKGIYIQNGKKIVIR